MRICDSLVRALMCVLVPQCAVGWALYSPYEGGTTGGGYKLNGVGVPWSTPASFNLSGAVWRWGLDQDPASTLGLSGGISWAIHPDFCTEITPAFREESFLFGAVTFMTCDTLRSAIGIAFSTWSANHPHLSFTDLTDACARDGGVEAESNLCLEAEVTISTTTMLGSQSDLVALVLPDVREQFVDRAPYTTAGDRLLGGIGMRRAEMRLSTSLCWYLDATFCAWFHDADKLFAIDSVDVVRLIILGVFLLAITYILHTLCGVYAAVRGVKTVREACLPRVYHSRASVQAHARRSRSLRCGPVVDYLARMRVVLLLFALFWAIFAPVFYATVMLPCVECYGFSGTLAHEIGHLLGFHHPDQLASMNLRATSPMDASTCHNPLAHVELSTPVEGADTLMNSVAAHRPTTCLTADDLEGLNFLYPACGESVAREPVCTKPARLTGWLRLLTAVMVPYSLVTLLVMSAQNIVRWCQRKHVQKLRENVRRRSQQAMWLRAGARAAWAGPKRQADGGKGIGRLTRGQRSFTRRVRPGMGAKGLIGALFAQSGRMCPPQTRTPASRPSESGGPFSGIRGFPSRNETRRKKRPLARDRASGVRAGASGCGLDMPGLPPRKQEQEASLGVPVGRSGHESGPFGPLCAEECSFATIAGENVREKRRSVGGVRT